MTDFEQKVIAGQELDIGQFTDATSGTVAALSSLNKSDIRLTAVTTLQGIANGFPGKLLYIFNASVSPITIANESGSATAANRILTGTNGNFTFAIDSGITLVYDGTSSRWRIAGNGTPGPQGFQGSQGSQGFQGSQGAQGSQGFQGSTPSFVAPTVQTFTTGSGTYTRPTGPTPLYIRVRIIGGGGGGGGSGTATAGAGGTGGNSSFGTTLITANGGTPGSAAATGIGGSASLGSGPIGFAIAGGVGSASQFGISAVILTGSCGAATPFGSGGAGGGNAGSGAGFAAVANTGAGGGGGSNNGIVNSGTGSGGPAGGYVDAIINSPSSTYAYSVGGGGAGGTAGVSGVAGGAGGSGFLIVEEFYQ